MTTRLPIFTVSNNCQDCYKCIRECPVKAIRIENSRASIIEERCTSCGHCTVVCPSGAKRYRSDLQKVEGWIDQGEQVVLSVAPSFYSFFGGNENDTANYFRSLGFFQVSETAWGAAVTSRSTEAWLRQFNGNLAISTACPAIVALVKMYYPQFTENLVPVASPMLMHASLLHQWLGTQPKIVFVGPCIAKKFEASCSNQVDAVLTFSELMQMVPIRPASAAKAGQWYPSAADSSSRRYPLAGGMIDSLGGGTRAFVSEAFAGMRTCRRILDDLTTSPLPERVFLELLACEGGCIMGPGTPDEGSVIKRKVRVERQCSKSTVPAPVEHLIPAIPADLPVNTVPLCLHTEAEILSAMESVGKHAVGDELNCGGCGYDRCREFALALLDGKAERTMCVSYMRRVAQDKASVLLKKMPYGVVMVDDKLRIVDSNLMFATLLGKEVTDAFEASHGLENADIRKIAGFHKIFSTALNTGEEKNEYDIREGDQYFHVSVVTILKHKIVCGILQNMKDARTRRAMATDRVQQVITQNMKVVQQIAFLLGENAAFTETMLNSVIDAHDAG